MKQSYYQKVIEIVNDFFHAFSRGSSWLTDVMTDVPMNEDFYYMSFRKENGEIDYDGWCHMGFLKDTSNGYNERRHYPKVFYYYDIDKLVFLF